MRWKKDLAIVIIFLILFLAFSFLMFEVFNLSGFILNIGIYNYLLVFFLSIFGSNFLTASFFYPLLFLMKNLGLNVFFMAIFAAVGGALGDSFFFFLGNRIGEKPHKDKRKNSRIFHFFKEHKNKPHVSFFIFLYASFFPASNEILTIILGYFNYPARKIIPPLILGNIVYYSLLITLGGSLFELLVHFG